MLKRWDTRNYDIELVLKVFDTIDIDFNSMDIPKPKVHDIRMITKALIVKEFEGLSLRSAEVRAEKLLGVRIDHSVLHFWEKKLAPYMEEIVNRILEKLHKLEYSESFADSTVFTNKKGTG
jgi:hypothetical protein